MSSFDKCKPFEGMSETAVRLMLRYPWFMGLYYSMRVYECNDLPTKTLATNGTAIWVDPGFWAQLTRDQRMTAVAHEMGHKMLLHCTRLGERNRFIWNIAGDHVINLMLTESGFTPLTDMTSNGQPWSWFCDEKYKGWTTEAVYDDVMKQAGEQCKSQTGKSISEWAKEGIGDAADMVDFNENPDGTPDAKGKGPNGQGETVGEYEQRVRRELKEAEQMSKIAGNCLSWMDRALGNADHIKVNWFDVLEQYLKSLTIADYSWSRFARKELVKKGVICPDMWQPAMGGVRIYIDASGSCWNALPKFNKHLKDVWEQVKPKWVEVRYFQTDVNHEYDQRFARGEEEIEVHKVGGGGTDFSWLADDLLDAEEKPEVCLFFTDMYGGFGREPENVPVIWLSVSEVSVAPFGQVINVN